MVLEPLQAQPSRHYIDYFYFLDKPFIGSYCLTQHFYYFYYYFIHLTKLALQEAQKTIKVNNVVIKYKMKHFGFFHPLKVGRYLFLPRVNSMNYKKK